MVSFHRLAGLGIPPWPEDSTERASKWDYFWIGPEPNKYYPLATCSCPNGHLASVSPRIHSISGDGTLSPSYVCPRENCSFHDFVRFDGWAEAEKEEDA